MPKSFSSTKKARALTLLRDLENGPSFSDTFEKVTPETALAGYKLWAETWIIPVVKEMIPELAKHLAEEEARKAAEELLKKEQQ